MCESTQSRYLEGAAKALYGVINFIADYERNCGCKPTAEIIESYCKSVAEGVME